MNTDPLRDLLKQLAAMIVEQITPELLAALPAAPSSDPMMLDAGQVADRLSISVSAVRALWKAGDLISVKQGGLRFTRHADLVAYVAALEPSRPGDEPAPVATQRLALAVVRDAA